MTSLSNIVWFAVIALFIISFIVDLRRKRLKWNLRLLILGLPFLGLGFTFLSWGFFYEKPYFYLMAPVGLFLTIFLSLILIFELEEASFLTVLSASLIGILYSLWCLLFLGMTISDTFL